MIVHANAAWISCSCSLHKIFMVEASSPVQPFLDHEINDFIVIANPLGPSSTPNKLFLGSLIMVKL